MSKNEHQFSYAVEKSIGEHDPRVLEDIKTSRDKLGEFTVGFFMEAVYGEEYARAIRKEVGVLYEKKLKDVSMDVVKQADGSIRTKVAGVNTTPDSEETKKKLVEVLDRHDDELARSSSESYRRAQKAAMIPDNEPEPVEQEDDMVSALKALASMSPAERDALLKLAKAMGRK